MINLNNKQNFLDAKKKIYYDGVALIALMCASSTSLAMELEDNEMPRIRCLWNLEKRNFRASALEILEKKVFQEPFQKNAKLRINYIKKLGEFLKENPRYALDLKLLKPGNENENSPLSQFYKETLDSISQSKTLLPVEQPFQTLKLKTFYSRFIPEFIKVNIKRYKENIEILYSDSKKSSLSDDLQKKLKEDFRGYTRSDVDNFQNNMITLTKMSEWALKRSTETDVLAEKESLAKIVVKINALFQEGIGLNFKNFEEEMNDSYNVLFRKPGVDRDKLKYFKHYYFENKPNIKDLDNLANQVTGIPLRGKINCKLGHISVEQPATTKSVSTQASYYFTASQNKYPLAQYYLAELYNTNSDIHKDEGFYKPQEAYELYTEAALDGKILLAYYKLATHLKTELEKKDKISSPSTGKEKDKKEALEEEILEHHKYAASQGHPYSQYELAQNFMTNQKEKEGIYLLQQSAESGYSKAQFDLAQKYEQGYGGILKKSADLALFWYHKAASQEEGEAAKYSLGRIFENEGKHKKAIKLYNQSSDPRAHVRLGKMYLKGIGQKKSDLLAIDHFIKANSQGNADGAYYLGLMKFMGQGFSKPEHEGAFNNFEHAAAQNHPKALFRLGVMKQFGIGTQQSYEEAKTFYERAGKQENASALYYLGNLYKKGLFINTAVDETIRELETNADSENKPQIMRFVEAVEKDKSKQQEVLLRALELDHEDTALNLLEKSANLGYKEAAYKVGKFYLNEWHDKKNEKSAKNARLYLEKAGSLNHTDALYLLAFTQEQGIGCPQDAIGAIKSYTQVAEAGDASAQFKLGKFCETTLEPEDKINAFAYYKRAAKQGHVDARFALGKLYQERGTSPKDLEKAFAYFKGLDKEIKPPVLNSMKQLANGGHQKAITWFREKAEEGNAHSQHFLGKLLETGVYLPQDMPEAIALYTKAAKQGKRSAQRQLDEFKQIHLIEDLGSGTEAPANFPSETNKAPRKSVKTASNAEKISTSSDHKIDLKTLSHEEK